MEVFVARQPIFNRMEEVYGYEILYRNNEINRFPNIDGDQATADVIINSFLNIGIDRITDGKPCFINFTENLLDVRLPTYFQPKDIVIEILETVVPSEKVIAICKELKELGYKLALDDFIFQSTNPYAYKLLEYADIVKIDFKYTPVKTRIQLENLAKQWKKEMVAEKLETEEEYVAAKKAGYHYFQGYYFSKPHILSTHDVPTYIYSYAEISKLLVEEEPNFERIVDLIEHDISLSYKLLRLINTVGFQLKRKVTSIRQAVVYLGFMELKKWLYIIAVREKNQSNGIVNEVINTCLVRAKMCESVAKLIPNKRYSDGYFLTGMFSLMDTILQIPLEEIMTEIPLDESIVDALLGKENLHRQVLDIILAVETADWIAISEGCKELLIEEMDVFKLYAESINWAKHVLEYEYY